MSEQLTITERQAGKKEEKFFWETKAMAEILMKNQEYVEAQLQGRRALKGFKKLGEIGSEGYEKSLMLLVEISQIENKVDEENAYTALLTRHQSKNQKQSSFQRASSLKVRRVDALKRTDSLEKAKPVTFRSISSNSDANVEPIISASSLRSESSNTATTLESGTAVLSQLSMFTKSTDALTSVSSHHLNSRQTEMHDENAHRYSPEGGYILATDDHTVEVAAGQSRPSGQWVDISPTVDQPVRGGSEIVQDLTLNAELSLLASPTCPQQMGSERESIESDERNPTVIEESSPTLPLAQLKGTMIIRRSSPPYAEIYKDKQSNMVTTKSVADSTAGKEKYAISSIYDSNSQVPNLPIQQFNNGAKSMHMGYKPSADEAVSGGPTHPEEQELAKRFVFDSALATRHDSRFEKVMYAPPAFPRYVAKPQHEDPWEIRNARQELDTAKEVAPEYSTPPALMPSDSAVPFDKFQSARWRSISDPRSGRKSPPSEAPTVIQEQNEKKSDEIVQGRQGGFLSPIWTTSGWSHRRSASTAARLSAPPELEFYQPEYTLDDDHSGTQQDDNLILVDDVDKDPREYARSLNRPHVPVPENEPLCPICGTSIRGPSENYSAVHVNICLDNSSPGIGVDQGADETGPHDEPMTDLPTTSAEYVSWLCCSSACSGRTRLLPNSMAMCPRCGHLKDESCTESFVDYEKPALFLTLLESVSPEKWGQSLRRKLVLMGDPLCGKTWLAE